MIVQTKTESTTEEAKRIPSSITFTGADRFSDIMGMLELSEQYPIEHYTAHPPTTAGWASETSPLAPGRPV